MWQLNSIKLYLSFNVSTDILIKYRSVHTLYIVRNFSSWAKVKYNINGNRKWKHVGFFYFICTSMHAEYFSYTINGHSNLLAFNELIRFRNHFGALELFLTFSFCQRQKNRRGNGLCGLIVAGHDYESIPGWYVERPVGSSPLTLPLSLMFSALKFSTPAASQCIWYVTLPTMHNGLVINLFL